MTPIRPLPSRCAAAGLLPLLIASLTPLGSAQAQDSLRSTFPGRRVGGGTRGDCAGRVVAHLVSASNVLGAAGPTTLGVLEGPAAKPRPLVIDFRKWQGSDSAGAADPSRSRTLAASAAGITLLSIPAVGEDTVWESTYRCDETPAGAADSPLAFVSNVAPPAQSLLVSARRSEDSGVTAELRKLRSSCGATVATGEVAVAFGFTDLITPEWPAQLPVRCP